VDEPDSFRADLPADVPDQERTQLWQVADTLIGARPFPRAAFRSALHRRLTGALRQTGTYERPRALWARVSALALPGTALLCLVAIGVAHAGPFAP
jgi:hypothetical protein